MYLVSDIEHMLAEHPPDRFTDISTAFKRLGTHAFADENLIAQPRATVHCSTIHDPCHRFRLFVTVFLTYPLQL